MVSIILEIVTALGEIQGKLMRRGADKKVGYACHKVTKTPRLKGFLVTLRLGVFVVSPSHQPLLDTKVLDIPHADPYNVGRFPC